MRANRKSEKLKELRGCLQTAEESQAIAMQYGAMSLYRSNALYAKQIKKEIAEIERQP